ncbi:hypothetical protein ACODAR_001527, partial [Citrobacter freundii]
REINTPPEEAHRHRGRPSPAHRATKTQTRRMVGSNFDRTAPWLARIVGAVQRAPARAAIGASPSRQVMVDAQQQREELRIVQEDMAHCDGL